MQSIRVSPSSSTSFVHASTNDRLVDVVVDVAVVVEVSVEPGALVEVVLVVD
jgi:hypothetical protein